MNATQLLEHFDRLAEAPDAVPRLRRFILDLAVRGKLVAQDAGDEPAGELLKRIRAAKAQLVKAGKFKEAKVPATILGDLPANQLPQNWRWVPFGATVDMHRGGGTPSKANSTYWNGEILWASVKDIGKSKYLDNTIDRITKVGLADSSSNLIEPGNLIVVTRMGLGKVSINRVPVAINQDLRALSLSSLMSIDYCYIYFKTHGFEGSGLTVKGIKIEELLGIAFPLPPLAEQQRIVAKVAELMALCDQLEAAQQERERRRERLAAASLQRLNQPAADTKPEAQRDHARFHLHHLSRLTTLPEHIKAMREVVLDAAFQGTLTTQDSSDGTGRELVAKVFQLALTAAAGSKKVFKRPSPEPNLYIEPAFPTPGAWGWASLQMLCDQIGDIDHKMPRAVDVGVPFLSARDLRDGGVLDFSNPKYISEEDFARLSRKVLPKRNDIIYSRIGARLGKARLVEVDTRFLISYSCCLIRPKHEFVDKRYLQIFLDSHLALQQAHSGVQSIGVPDLGLGEIKAYRIPLPPLAEQIRIVAKVEALMALCDELEDQLTITQTDSRRLLEAVMEAALVPV